MKWLFLSGSDPEGISQDLRSADCNNLHEIGEKRPEYTKVFPLPQISLNLEHAYLPVWKLQWFTLPLTLTLDFFFLSSVSSKFTAYMKDCMQGTPTKYQGQEASNLTLKILAKLCFTIIHLQESFTWVVACPRPLYADIPGAYKQGFQDDSYLQVWWHCVSLCKSQNLWWTETTGTSKTTSCSVHAAAQQQQPVLAALWKRNRPCREHRGYGMCTCTNSSCFQPNFGEKSKPAKQILLYFREQQPLHLSAMCWLCSRGINARSKHGYPSTPLAETFVFMQEGPWPNFSC